MVVQATKQQLILAIQGLNRSASETFLGQFNESDLQEYLSSLRGNVRPLRTRSSEHVQEQQAVVVG